MEVSQFGFLHEELPGLYRSTARAERAYVSNPAAALADLKHSGSWLTANILHREERPVEGMGSFELIAELERLELLKPAFIAVLTRLELTDPRESELFVDAFAVKDLLYGIYDLACWYYATYVDDGFVPKPLYVAPAVGRGEVAIPGEEKRLPKLPATVGIDDAVRDAEWEESCAKHADAAIRKDERGGTYIGETLRDWRHGKGTYVWVDGTKYEGGWYRDMEYGKGEKRFSNGDSYSGEWKDGCFHGQGLYKWADGTVYEGKWDNHLEHGRGRKTYPDGTVQNGFWSNGEFVHTGDRLDGPMVQPGQTGV
jgi:hypothetical protein